MTADRRPAISLDVHVDMDAVLDDRGLGTPSLLGPVESFVEPLVENRLFLLTVGIRTGTLGFGALLRHVACHGGCLVVELGRGGVVGALSERRRADGFTRRRDWIDCGDDDVSRFEVALQEDWVVFYRRVGRKHRRPATVSFRNASCCFLLNGVLQSITYTTWACVSHRGVGGPQ